MREREYIDHSNSGILQASSSPCVGEKQLYPARVGQGADVAGDVGRAPR